MSAWLWRNKQKRTPIPTPVVTPVRTLPLSVQGDDAAEGEGSPVGDEFGARLDGEVGVDVCSNTITQTALSTNGKKRCVPLPAVDGLNVSFGQYDQEELALFRQRLDEHFREAENARSVDLDMAGVDRPPFGRHWRWFRTVDWFSRRRREEKAQRNRFSACSSKTVPVSFRVCSLSPGKILQILQGVLLCLPQGHETNVSTGPVVQVPLSRTNLPSVSQPLAARAEGCSQLQGARLSEDSVPCRARRRMLSAPRFPSVRRPSIDLSGEEEANSHESCETLAVCHNLNAMSPACLSSQNHSCHHARALDSNVVRSVSPSSGSVSYVAASLPAALPAAGVAAAVGFSLGDCRGVAPGVGAGVARGSRCSCCMEWGGRWAFSLSFFHS